MSSASRDCFLPPVDRIKKTPTFVKKDIRYRLSLSTVIEPLVNGWYAWSYLLSPVPSSLHLMQYQLPLLRSYLEDPQGHYQMARDPEFAGGPFCNISPAKAHRVKDLLERTEYEQRANIEFAEDILNFQQTIQDEANGQCLDPYYDQAPASLRGFIELVYDYYDHPTVRFIEGLLYESRYYNKNQQSFRIFQLSRDEDRPFFLSTPRFVEEGEFGWKVAFDDPALDEFLKLDIEPQPIVKILDLLGLKKCDEKRILPHLTEELVHPPEKWKERKVRIRYFGHACVLLEWNGVAILIDPFLPVIPRNGVGDRLSFHDLPEKIDFAVVTHEHQDHFSLETLLRLRGRIECLVVPKSLSLLHGDISLRLLAKKLNFKQVIDLDALESISIPDGEIIGIPFLGEHGDLAQGKIAYVIRAGKEQVLFAADSDCLDRNTYTNVRKAIGSVETIFLGTECVGAPLSWKLGPLFPKKPSWQQDQTRRQRGCDAKRASDLIEALGGRRFYSYAMGKEPWLEHVLGGGLQEDSPQLRELKTLIQWARSRGFGIAESLIGKREIYLAQTQQTLADDFPDTCEMAEDQFAF